MGTAPMYRVPGMHGRMPDPRIRQRHTLREMPVAVFGLVPQPAAEDTGLLSIEQSTHNGRCDEMAVSISYTLWRNPADHDDPVNLRDLSTVDDVTRAALEQLPPGRPAWIADILRHARYPMLSEAVRTTWARQPSERTSLAETLAHHVTHVLMNQYRDEATLGGRAARTADAADSTAVRPATRPVMVDGTPTDAMEWDVDPRVYGVGVQIAAGHLVTAVLPRDQLSRLTIAFATHPDDI